MTIETNAACVQAATLLKIQYNNIPLKPEEDAVICSDVTCMEGTALPSGCLVVIKNTNKDLYVNTDIEFGEEGDIKDLIFNKNSKSVKPKCSRESACICRSGSALSACENDAGKQPNEVSCSCGNDICDYTNPFCTKSSISNKGFCSPTLQCKDKNI